MHVNQKDHGLYCLSVPPHLITNRENPQRLNLFPWNLYNCFSVLLNLLQAQ